jgi:ATP-binding cassette subfamily C protein CydC
MKKTSSTKSTKLGKAKSSTIIFIRLCLLFIPYYHWISLGIFLSVLTVIANVGLMAISGWFIASMAVAGLAGELINYFAPAAGIRACAVGRAGSRYLERLVTHSATLRMLAELRHWFYIHIEPLAPAIIQQYHSGDLFSRIRADIDTLENAYLRIITPMITALIAGSLFVYFMSRYDPLLAGVEALFLIFSGLIMPFIILCFSRKAGRTIVKTSADLRQHSIDSIHGLGELLIYGAAEQQAAKINKLSRELNCEQTKLSNYDGIAQAVLGLCAGLALLIVIIITTPLISGGDMPPVTIAMLALFTIASFEAVAAMPQAFQRLPETVAAGSRIFEIIDSKPIVTEPVPPSPQPDNFDIEFQNVTFSYGSGEKNVFEDLSFVLATGSRLAIVGRSGAGKSSIVNLLLRFQEVDNGRIFLGGYPLEQYHGEDARRYISVVTQQNQLFNNSVRENLLLADPDADKELMVRVCKTAMIHDFIMTLPQGYDTWIGEAGFKLSGGQLKRLAIARALLKPAKILILDEPGEGLDRKTEKELLLAVFEYKKSASILLITHSRISGIDILEMEGSGGDQLPS